MTSFAAAFCAFHKGKPNRVAWITAARSHSHVRAAGPGLALTLQCVHVQYSWRGKSALLAGESITLHSEN